MSDKDGGGAPSWLFSFVDLAFLMVIAMTQLAADPSADQPDLGEMIVPRISSESSSEMPAGASRAWQLRVHPPADDGLAPIPFELILVADPAGPEPEQIEDAALLRDRLAELAAAGDKRPVLAPHADARSQDLLDAASAVEDFWPGRRRVTVARVLAAQ